MSYKRLEMMDDGCNCSVQVVKEHIARFYQVYFVYRKYVIRQKLNYENLDLS